MTRTVLGSATRGQQSPPLSLADATKGSALDDKRYFVQKQPVKTETLK